MTEIVPIVLALLVRGIWANDMCVCSLNRERQIYTKPDLDASLIGNLAMDQCRRLVYPINETWKAIMFDDQVGLLGFIVVNNQSMIQNCPSVKDTLTTAKASQTTSKTATFASKQSLTLKTTHSIAYTTTHVPTFSPTITTIPEVPDSLLLEQTTTQNRRTTTIPLFTITTPQPTTTKTTAVTTMPITTTTPKPITTMPPTTPITTTPTTTAIATTTTPKPTTTTTQSPKTTTPTTTTITTTKTTLTTTTSTTLATTTIRPSQGNTNMCPSNLRSRTHPDNLFQHSVYCYEYVPKIDSWVHAEYDCKNKGGVMLFIENQSDQDFVYNMLIHLHMYEPLWLGLHDITNEERWEWVSGAPLKYTNWMPGRFRDQYHDQEDCALFVYARKGQWDDVFCSGTEFSEPIRHSWICQYNTTLTSSIIG